MLVSYMIRSLCNFYVQDAQRRIIRKGYRIPKLTILYVIAIVLTLIFFARLRTAPSSVRSNSLDLIILMSLFLGIKIAAANTFAYCSLKDSPVEDT